MHNQTRQIFFGPLTLRHATLFAKTLTLEFYCIFDFFSELFNCREAKYCCYETSVCPVTVSCLPALKLGVLYRPRERSTGEGEGTDAVTRILCYHPPTCPHCQHSKSLLFVFTPPLDWKLHCRIKVIGSDGLEFLAFCGCLGGHNR